MSQNNVDYSGNPTGSQLMDNYLAKSQDNVLTTNSGVQRPSYAKSGTQWIDTSSNPWKLYLYNGSKDVLIGTISTGSSGTFIVSGVDDSNYVKLSGTQTVGGNKTFSSLLNVSVDGIKFATENGTNYYQVRASGSPKAGLSFLLNNSASYSAMNLTSSSITIGSANITPLSVTAATSDNSNKIATTAFVKNQGYISDDSNYVKLTGNQSINGSKTFISNITVEKSNPTLQCNNTAITKGTAPSSNINSYILTHRDNNGKNVSGIVSTYNTSKDVHTRIYAYKSTASTDTADTYLRVYYNANGKYGLQLNSDNASGDTNESLTKSTTSINDSTIPCMGWVNAKLQNILIRYVNGDSGYIIYDFGGDKYMEQWGHHTFSGTGWNTITLSQAYVDNKFSVMGSQSGDSTTLNYVKFTYENTTTTFQARSNGSGTGLNWRTFGKAA